MIGDRSSKPFEHAGTNATVDEIEIQPAGRVHGRIRPPGSKSLTNRALVVAALADGESTLTGALDSEDTQVMIESWRRLGVAVTHDPGRAVVEVTGCSGRIPVASAELFLANSGTSIRFLTAVAALGHGTFRLDGVPRMRQRPVEDLLAALRSLGADARSELGTGCPPVLVRSTGLQGGTIRVAGSESSQFTSALLMAAPYATGDVHVEVAGELVSEPFVHMTTRVMEDFGVRVKCQKGDRSNLCEAPSGPFRQIGPVPFLALHVPSGRCYAGRTYPIEPDATAASYFFAAAAITGGEMTVEGLGCVSMQGDLAFVDLLEQMGAKVIRAGGRTTVMGNPLHGIDADMRAISDTALTLAVVAAFADSPTTIRNVAHIRAQETDRIHAVATELAKIGAAVEEHPDGLTIRPAPLHGARIETYNDHRVAMSFAIVGLRTPGIIVTNPACTAKTYPRFFEDLEKLAAS